MQETINLVDVTGNFYKFQREFTEKTFERKRRKDVHKDDVFVARCGTLKMLKYFYFPFGSFAKLSNEFSNEGIFCLILTLICMMYVDIYSYL